MATLQSRVRSDYTVYLPSKTGKGRDEANCALSVMTYVSMCNGACAFKVDDEQKLVPNKNSGYPPDGFVPMRCWILPEGSMVDVVTMHIAFGQMDALTGVAFPTLNWRLLVGGRGTTDRVMQGTYVPPNASAGQPNETGMLLQYSGRLFDTLEIHMFYNDPAAPGANLGRKPAATLSFFAMLGGHARSFGQTGLNGTVSFVAPNT